MYITRRALIFAVAALLVCLPLAVPAQWDKKPYTEWNDKDVQKLLHDSPWARTQTFSDVVPLIRPMPPSGPGAAGADRPVSNAIHVNFRIRFLSAKPIRQAISRLMELQQKEEVSDDLAAQLKAFASGEFIGALPRTATGKIQKNLLREKYWKGKTKHVG